MWSTEKFPQSRDSNKKERRPNKKRRSNTHKKGLKRLSAEYKLSLANFVLFL